MAPIRRYLRITKYSVLEVRIYLDNPGLAQSWLLNPRNPVLPRVIESVRPLVLPKLREEKERSRKKSTKKKGIKDIVVEDDFEVSIFLTETSTRHSLLTKHKHFHDTTQTKLTSNSVRLVGASNEAPIDIDDLETAVAPITLRREDSDDGDAAAALAAIPSAPAAASRRPKRARRNTTETLFDCSDGDDGDYQDHDLDLEILDSDQEDSDDGESTHPGTSAKRPAKRRKEAAGNEKDDNKKKLAMDISYEGFSIYGRVLCLVVKCRDGPSAAGRGGAASGGSTQAKKQQNGPAGQTMMENFIISTQMPAGDDVPS